jgi:EAL domain-containing protein (putative c-di-GMP-specific phosphodiesterase class I)/response regulator RpfG family c-di-GMP phosphodiesterase
VYLPLADVDLPADVPGGDQGDEATHHGGRILVVEDDPELCELVRDSLDAAGYLVEASADGAAALQRALAADQPFDLVITDVVMPRVSGPELAARLRTQWPGLRVLFLSGYTSEMLRRHGVRVESEMVVEKPFTRYELLAAASRCLAAPLRTAADVAARPGVLRLLVADDDPGVLDAVTALLADVAHVDLVATARGADAAIAAAAASRPDVALVDVAMPGGGPAAVRGMVDVCSGVSVLAYSGSAAPEQVDTMLAAGAVGYLLKSASREELLDAIGRTARGEGVLAGAVSAGVVGGLRRRLADEAAEREDRLSRVATAASLFERMHMVFQPVVTTDDRRVVGYEALARFADTGLGPEAAFPLAAGVGLGTDLELSAVRRAIEAFEAADLPLGLVLGVNLSPTSVVSGGLAELRHPVGGRLLVELTEQEAVVDEDELAAACEDLRRRGMAIAADDAGAGYAGLARILRLQPEVIKIDRSMLSAVDADPAQQALVQSLVLFGSRLGATLVAEGIERAAQLTEVGRLGVTRAQGYLLGRPGPLPTRCPPADHPPTPR